jgi:hypothetical protein
VKTQSSQGELSRLWKADIETAAAKGRAGALIALAVAKMSGRDPYGGDVERDIEGARALLERARLSGAVTATHLLACSLEVAGDPAANAAAIALHEEAARNGSFHSCIALGRVYGALGDQLAPNELASKWYQAALDIGHDVDDLQALDEARAYVEGPKPGRTETGGPSKPASKPAEPGQA